MSTRALTWRTGEKSADQTRILEAVLARLAGASDAPVATFDLDSTLFDNRTRQLAILTEFAGREGLGGVERLAPEEIDGWLVADALARLDGVGGRLDALKAAFKDYWRTRFFTSEMCRHDVPLPGAAEYVGDVAGTGTQVVYLTGRHEPMRAGSEDSLAAGGFPEGRLIMKPTLEMTDTAFKELAVARIRPLGEVLACFDNETTHVNRLRAAFPEATVVWVKTDFSPEAEPVAEGVPAIHGFLR